MPDSDIVVTLERMATETAMSWSDIRKPEQHEPGYEWYVAAISEVKVLRAAADEIERLRAERDEARREVCELDADTSEDQRAYAAQRGWDCFDIDTKENT